MVEEYVPVFYPHVWVSVSLALPGYDSGRSWHSLYLPQAVLAEPVDVQRAWVVAAIRKHYRVNQDLGHPCGVVVGYMWVYAPSQYTRFDVEGKQIEPVE